MSDTPRLTSLAPQFLVDDLDRAIAFYRDVLGFTFGTPWGGFYAVGTRDGFELHLKCAPKNDAERQHRRANEHLDLYAAVAGIDEFHAACAAKGAAIIKPLAPTAWGTRDFYVLDPDGYVLCFAGTPTT
ncbi:MAG TPA: VOC family protein [Stellaceae bacterium]|nr:VOC family protein [Stellaceae bacterium]